MDPTPTQPPKLPNINPSEVYPQANSTLPPTNSAEIDDKPSPTEKIIGYTAFGIMITIFSPLIFIAIIILAYIPGSGFLFHSRTLWILAIGSFYVLLPIYVFLITQRWNKRLQLNSAILILSLVPFVNFLYLIYMSYLIGKLRKSQAIPS